MTKGPNGLSARGPKRRRLADGEEMAVITPSIVVPVEREVSFIGIAVEHGNELIPIDARGRAVKMYKKLSVPLPLEYFCFS